MILILWLGHFITVPSMNRHLMIFPTTPILSEFGNSPILRPWGHMWAHLKALLSANSLSTIYDITNKHKLSHILILWLKHFIMVGLNWVWPYLSHNTHPFQIWQLFQCCGSFKLSQKLCSVWNSLHLYEITKQIHALLACGVGVLALITIIS